ncbi:MAG: cytochrome c oxidase accessory protein CcoG, partial [Gammaproteobacteria bacterium]|nr:cytochrome c oxidase accessory protein CcoG [Gammaproteobacteria bacterium]
LQYQCIACAACVDACDQVMERMNYPKGLIRYTTENAVAGVPIRLFRPRLLVYGLILVALAVALGVSLGLRTPLALDVIRDRNALYRQTPEGLVENVYTLKIINMDDDSHSFRLSARGIEGAELLTDDATIEVGGGDVRSLVARLRVDPYILRKPSSRVVFELSASDNPSLKVETEGRFLGPVQAR